MLPHLIGPEKSSSTLIGWRDYLHYDWPIYYLMAYVYSRA